MNIFKQLKKGLFNSQESSEYCINRFLQLKSEAEHIGKWHPLNIERLLNADVIDFVLSVPKKEVFKSSKITGIPVSKDKVNWEEVNWPHVYELELRLLEHADSNKKNAMISFYEDIFRSIASKSAICMYMDRFVKTPRVDDNEKVLFLLRYCHKSFALYPAEEFARVKVVRHVKWMCYKSFLLLVSLILFAYLFSIIEPDVWRIFLQNYAYWGLIISTVAVTGAFGSFFSFQKRIYAAAASGRILVAIIEERKNLKNLDIVPLTGAVFAVVLMFIFAAGFVNGDMFPKIADLFEDHINYHINFIEFAKLLVWSFIAGFAEKFVPDVLDKIAKREDKTDAEEAYMNSYCSMINEGNDSSSAKPSNNNNDDASQIEGEWDVTEIFEGPVPGVGKYTMRIQCQRGRVTGTYSCNSGPDKEGLEYNIEGTYKNQILSIIWTSNETIESGTITARRLVGDPVLVGHGLFIEPKDGNVYTSKFEAKKG